MKLIPVRTDGRDLLTLTEIGKVGCASVTVESASVELGCASVTLVTVGAASIELG